MSYLIEFKFGLDWQSYPVTLNDFTITEVLHNNLKPADSSCTFSLIPDLSLYNLLRGIDTQNIPVRIKKNNSIIFYGYIRKTFEFKKTQRLQPVKIELVSPSFILKKKITTEHRYVDTSLNTIVVALLQAGGITNYNLPNFGITVPVFLAPEDATYHDVLSTLLLEYGYLFYFDKEGAFRVHRIYPESLYTTKQFNGSNCIDQISQTKKEEQKEKIIVKWYEIKHLQNVIVFSDTTNAQNGYKCHIELAPQQYLGDKEEWYAEFHHDEGEILYTSGISLDIVKGPSIQVLKFQQAGNRALLSIRNNNSLYTERILKLDIKAQTVKVKKGINASIVARSSNPNATEEIQANYIFTKAYADALANYLSWYYKYCDFTYKLRSKTDYEIGDLVVISEYGLGSITARITKKVTQIQSGVMEFELEAVSEYTPESVSGESFVSNLIPNTTIDNLYQQIDQLNTSLSGQDRDQIIPLNPIAVEAKAFIDGIYLKITPAAGGTILEQANQYIVQRSIDQGTTWFDLNGIQNGSAKISNTQFQWLFNRITDGYPEASGDPEPWNPISYYRFRVKAVNSIGTENPNWVYVTSVDTSGYGTWLPPQPTGAGGISAMREVRVMVDAPSNVYGICGYEIQISKDQTNWYKPALGLDVYASEDNWKQGNLGEYRRISVPQWTQSVPLENQATSPKNTTYYFRFRIVTDRPYISGTPSGYVNSNGKAAGQWTSPISVVATATSAYDVIKARKADGTMQEGALGADKIYAENLAAIIGNLSAISGGQDDPYNYWALSDYPGRPSDRPVGTFRAGTQDVYIKSKPTAQGTDTDPYIELVSKNGHSIKLTNEGMKFSNAVGAVIGANDGTIGSIRTKEINLQDGGKIYGGGYSSIGSNPTGNPGFYMDSSGNIRITKGQLIGAQVPVLFVGSSSFGGFGTFNLILDNYYNSNPDITALSNGDIYLFYGRSNALYYRKYSGSWGAETFIVNINGIVRCAAITLPNDEIYICVGYYDSGNKIAIVRRFTNGTFEIRNTFAYPNSSDLGTISYFDSGKLLIVGGSRFHLYDQVTNTLAPHANDNQSISIANTIATGGQTIIGFSISGGYLKKYIIYENTIINEFSVSISSEYTNMRGKGSLLIDNRILIPVKRITDYAYSAYLIINNQTYNGYTISPADQQYEEIRDVICCQSLDKTPVLLYTKRRNVEPYYYKYFLGIGYNIIDFPNGVYNQDLGSGIVEYGKNTNGYWIKFSNGVMVCWGWFDNTIPATSYPSTIQSYIYSFPAAFSQRPVISVHCAEWDSALGVGGARYEEGSSVALPTQFFVACASNHGSTTLSIIINYMAIGRWK